jgi:hypothetical protein
VNGAQAPGRSRALAVVAGLCVAAAAIGGYLAGNSGGADLDRARQVGEQRGRDRAAADRSAYRAAYAEGRKTGYRQAYTSARKAARKGPGQ